VSGPVIFDCDGVLVDSEPLSNRALAETLTELGVPMTTEESIRRFMGRSWGTVEAYLAERGAGVPPDLEERYRARMFGAFASGLRPVAGIEAALDAVVAAGVPTCVASSGDPEKIAYTLGLTGLLPRFEGRIFSTVEVARGKPAPDLFLHAAARMGWAPGATTVVEDSPAGVQAGRAAGMRVLAYAGGLTGEAELWAAGASGVFGAMAELPPLLLSPPA
jgi:HAD superfamily hydrolase (TIGR01509 family)